MKLSETQQHVIDRMKSGWQLGCSVTDLRFSLQKDGIGGGGDVERVHGNTVDALFLKGVIIIDLDGFPTRTYKLVENAI